MPDWDDWRSSLTKRLNVDPWKNRIIRHGEQAANQFLAHDLNARRHPVAQREALRGSLNAVGWVAPVIVSAHTQKILDGHARVEEVLSRDENALVPFVEVDVSENEERTILAAFDPITGMATYDREALDTLLREVDTGEAALQALMEDLAAQNGVIPLQDPNELWTAMPEFENAPQAVRSLIVHFATHEDLQEFCKLIDQEITDKTKFIWHPARERKQFDEVFVSDENA